MAKRFFIAIMAFVLMLAAYADNPNRTYTIKYIDTNSGVAAKNMTIKVAAEKITYVERNTYWTCEYRGTTKDQNGLVYHKYYLPTTKSNVLISDSKIMKLGNAFYYIIILNGQYHYAIADNPNKSVEQTFKPIKATITDSQGSFTSSTFDCPNMIVVDKGNAIQISWGGENNSLSKSNSPGTYVASQAKPNTTMKFVAYRSSSSGTIYLVICTTRSNGKSVDIHFKP